MLKGFKLLAAGILAGIVIFLAVLGGQSLFQKKTDTKQVTDSTLPANQAETNNPQTSVNDAPQEGSTTTADETTNATDAQQVSEKPLELAPAVQSVLVEEEGKLQLHSLDARRRGLNGTFMIYDEEGVQVAAVPDTNQATMSVQPGEYEVTFAAKGRQQTQVVEVYPNKVTKIVFQPDQLVTRIDSGNSTQNTTQQNKPQPAKTTPPAKVESVPVESSQNQSNQDSTNQASTPNPTQAQVTGTNKQQPIVSSGRLLVSALLGDGNRNVNASFYVQKPNGQQVEVMRAVPSGTFDLPAGEYKVTARYGESTKTRKVLLSKDLSISEVFRFSPPVEEKKQGQLAINVVADGNKRPIKANIYVQSAKGKHIAKTNYATSGRFLLEPGNYRITVKARGYDDNVKTIKVAKAEKLAETFALSVAKQVTKPEPAPVTLNTAPATQQPDDKKDKPVFSGESKPAVAAKPGRLKASVRLGLARLGARYVVINERGKRVARIGRTQNADFELMPGRYQLVIRHKRQRVVKNVRIASGKTLNLEIPATEFAGYQEQKKPDAVATGRLKVSALSTDTGAPIKASFTVYQMNGKVLQRVHGVARLEMNLPPQTVIVSMVYRGAESRSKIQVRANNESDFTFSIKE